MAAKDTEDQKPDDAETVEGARPDTKTSFLATGGSGVQEHLREAVILATLVRTPDIVEVFEPGLEALECRDPVHARLRDVIVRLAPAGAEALHDKIASAVGADALEKLLNLPHVAITPAVRQPGDADLARATVAEELAKIGAERGLRAEISEAAEDLTGIADEAVTWRLGEAVRVRESALRHQVEEGIEYDTGDNGARMSRREREEFEALISRIQFGKPGG